MEKRLYDLKINPAYKSLIPAPTAYEYGALEASLLAEGCHDPLITCNGVIIDGHTRYEICHKHNIPFEYIEMEFKDEKAVKLWMAKNQLARRNINVFGKCEVLIKVEEPLREKLEEEAEERRRRKISEYRKNNETAGNCPASNDIETREVIAQMAGTSARTYKKVKYVVENGAPETISLAENGEISIDRAYRDTKEKKVPVKDSSIPEVQPEEMNIEEPEEAPTSDTPDLCSYIEHQTEDPVMHTEPERDPRPYQFVRDQVEFAVDNMIADMKVGVYCLRDEDFDKKKELKAIIKEGCRRAANIIDEMEKLG